MITDSHVKVYFEFYNDILEEDYVEGVWAVIIDEDEGLYRIDNIPFFVKSHASDDIVLAVVENGRLIVKGLVEESGNSTLQIICFQKEQASPLQMWLEQMGCSWEGSHLPGYFSVDVPAKIAYYPIREHLLKLQEEEVLSFREACLAHSIE